VQERSLARQRRWLFKAQPVARQGSVSFRVKLTFAATDDQSQVSAAADVRYPNMNDRNQSQAGAPGRAGKGQQMIGNADATHAARGPSNAPCR